MCVTRARTDALVFLHRGVERLANRADHRLDQRRRQRTRRQRVFLPRRADGNGCTCASRWSSRAARMADASDERLVTS